MQGQPRGECIRVWTDTRVDTEAHPALLQGGLPVTPSRSLGFGMVKGNQTTELYAEKSLLTMKNARKMRRHSLDIIGAESYANYKVLLNSKVYS